MKRKNILIVMLSVIAVLAMTFGISTAGNFSAKADSVDLNAGELNWGWGTSEGGWEKTAVSDGSTALKQTKAEGENRLANAVALSLDGLSLDMTFAQEGGFALAANPYACYVTNSALTMKMANLGYGRLDFFVTKDGSNACIYENAADALAQTNKGTHIDGGAANQILFNMGAAYPVTVNVTFSKYSTYRYKMVVTGNMYGGMANKQGDSVTYYINVKDFIGADGASGLFEANTADSVKLIALGNGNGNSEMTVKASMLGKSEVVIDDDAADEIPVDLSGWGWGVNEEGWTSAMNEDGSYTVKQGSSTNSHNRYACPANLILDGLSVKVNFRKTGAIAFGNNPYGCYATDSALIFRLTNDYDRGNILISSNGTEEGMKFYQTAEDALSRQEKGTTVDGNPTGLVIFTSKTPVIRFDFKRYSTLRYQVTLTSESLYGGMGGKDGNSVTYFINTDDFSGLFEDADKQSVKLIAIGNNDGDCEMIVRAVQGETNKDLVEDAPKVDETWEEMITGEIVPGEGKKLVPFTENDVNAPSATINTQAEILENGVTVISNEGGAEWGDRTGMYKELQLDGLKLTSYYTNAKVGSLVSLILGDSPWNYYGEGNLCLTYTYYADKQARIYVGSNHDVNNSGGEYVSYLYKTREAAGTKDASGKADCIIFDGAQVKYSVEFVKLSDEVYSMTFQVLNGIAFHWANGFPEGTTDTITMYINVTEMYGGAAETAGNHLFTSNGYVMLAVASDLGKKNGMKTAYYAETPLGAVMNAEITLEKDSYELNGATADAVVLEVKGDGEVIAPEYYDVTYVNNDSIGTATVIITFKNGFSGVFTKNYQVVGRNASEAVVTLEYLSVVFTTMPNEPKVVSVKLGETTIDASDYTVSYKNNVNVGTATVTVTFRNAYSGKAEATFEITKIQKTVEAENVVLNLADLSEDKIRTLGGEYVYTVTDSDGNEVKDLASLKEGTYTVTAVKESATTVETAVYTLTINGSAGKTGGCFGSVNVAAYALFGAVCIALVSLFRKKEENR